MKKLLRLKYLIPVLLLVPTIGRAACTGSSPTWTTTPDYASVNTCVTNASRNDTINVSAGSATWTSTLTLTKGVTLQASGTVTISVSSNIVMIQGSPDGTSITNEDKITISGFTFNGNNVGSIMMQLQGASGISGTKPYRYYIIKNNFFKNQVPGTSDGVITAANANNDGQLRGVISGNDFDKCDIIMRVFSDNDTREWANTAFNIFHYGTEDNLYFETNNIHWSSSYSGGNPGWIETGQGGRLSIRYNTYNFTNATASSEIWDEHGFQNWTGAVNSGQTGTMITENYGNTFTNSNNKYRWVDLRGSWGLIFDNINTGAGGNSFDLYGESATRSCGSAINPAPSNYTPQVNNTYAFNNTVNGTNVLALMDGGNPTDCTVTENSNWWNQNASCTTSACSAGIGQGTTAPTGSCTTGVGYWVASTPGATVSSSVIQSGKFYKCTSTNTWTLYYTPYSYPHPLISGTPTAATPSCAPTSGNIPQTVTCSDATGGAIMCYTTNGTTPATNGATACTTGTKYTTALTISVAETLQVIAGGTGYVDSSISSYTYTTPTAATPSCSPTSGVVPQTITCSDSSGGVVMCYTTNGATPATNGTTGCTTGTLYSVAIVISSATTLKVIAGGTGYLNSSVVNYTYSAPTSGGIPVTFFGMNNDTRTGAGAYPTFPIGGIRLWNPTPTGTGWAASQTGPSTYDFTQLNARLSDAPANVDIMLTMGCTPLFIAAAPGTTTPCQGNTLMSASLPSDVATGDATWKGYITHLVNDSLAQTHHIKYYEMNNEADLTQYCYNGGSLGNTTCTVNAANVVTMVKDAYAIIHALDPTALVVSPTGSTTCTNNCGVHFLPAFFAAGGAPYIDIVGMHSYLFNIPVGGQFSNVPEQITNVISQLRTLMSTYSISGLPLWFTEGSWGGGTNNSSMTDDQKIGYLARDYLLMRIGGTARFYWYAYGNSAWGTLSDGAGNLTKSGTAMSLLVNWLVGSTDLPGNCSQNGALTWTCNLTYGGKQAIIFWNPTTTPAITFPGNYNYYLTLDNATVTPFTGSLVAGPKPQMVYASVPPVPPSPPVMFTINCPPPNSCQISINCSPPSSCQIVTGTTP